MIINIIILLAAFYILVKSSDYFVKSSSYIAKMFGISEFVIGLTLVAVGTSVPELASSIVASLKGSGSIVIGNVVGSNIANIALVIGISAIVMPIAKHRELVLKDGYIMLFITGLFVLALSDFKLTMIEGIILLVLYISYLMFLFEKKENFKHNEFNEFINYVFLVRYIKKLNLNPLTYDGSEIKSFFNKLISFNPFKKKEKEKKKININLFEKHSLGKNIFIMVISILGIILGAKFLIDQAIYFAELFSLSEVFIGLTIIAIGTSLPELSVTVSAIRNGFSGIALGNIVGSNIANILLVAGASSLFSTLTIEKVSYNVMMPYLFLITLLFLGLLKYKGINKLMGFLFLGIYFSFITLLLFF